jgi:hypothetical protein
MDVFRPARPCDATPAQCIGFKHPIRPPIISFRLARDDVLAATGRREKPFVYGSLPGEDFVLRAGQCRLSPAAG